MYDSHNKKNRGYVTQTCVFFRRPQYVISLNVVLSTLMMIMYQPFGYRLDHVSQLFELFGFILIALVYSLLFFKIIPSYFRKSFQYIRWTIGKNIIYLSTFLLITGLNIFLYDFHIVSGYSFPDYGGSYFAERMLVDVCGVFSIGIFPLYVSYLLEKKLLFKKESGCFRLFIIWWRKEDRRKIYYVKRRYKRFFGSLSRKNRVY